MPPTSSFAFRVAADARNHYLLRRERSASDPHLNALVPQAMRECSPARNSDPAAINGYWSRRWTEVSQLGAPRHVGAPNRLDVFLGGLRRESLARTGMVPGEPGALLDDPGGPVASLPGAHLGDVCDRSDPPDGGVRSQKCGGTDGSSGGHRKVSAQVRSAFAYPSDNFGYLLVWPEDLGSCRHRPPQAAMARST